MPKVKTNENDLLYDKLNKAIKIELDKRHIKHIRMAESLGLSRTSFENKLNRLHAKFNLVELQKLSRAFDYSLDDFISFSLSISCRNCKDKQGTDVCKSCINQSKWEGKE